MSQKNEFSEYEMEKMHREGLCTFVFLRGLKRGLLVFLTFTTVLIAEHFLSGDHFWYKPTTLLAIITAIACCLIGIASQWQLWYMASKRKFGAQTSQPSNNAKLSA